MKIYKNSLYHIIRCAEDLKHIVWAFGLGFFLFMALLLNNMPSAVFHFTIIYLIGDTIEKWMVMSFKIEMNKNN